MDWFVRRFLKASLAWLTVGVTVGVAMAFVPTLALYRTAHFHANLLGFVAMMIFGVAYHVIPRFTGHQLHSRRLAGAHWWIANLGLAAFVVGLALRANGAVPVASAVLVALGGLASAGGAYLFAYNLWRTIDGPRAARRAEARVAGVPHAADVVPLKARRS